MIVDFQSTPDTPRLTGEGCLVDRVLNLVASKICLTAEEVQSFFALTYLGFQRAKETETLAGDVEKMLAALVRGQLIRMDEEGRVEATTLGEVTARKGVQAATAVKLARFFTAAGAREVSELELLYLLSLTADGRRMYIPLSSAEHRSRLYEKQVNQWLQENGYELGEEVQGLLQARMLPTAQEVRGAKLAMLALGWIAGEEIAELEQHYQCYAGTIRTQMEQLSWLADAAAEIAQVMGWEPAYRLNDLAERLQLGVDTAGLMIARTIPGARRAAIKAMVASGVITPTTSSPEFSQGEQTPEPLAKQATADLQLPLFAPQSS